MQFVSQLRRDHSQLRAEVAAKTALGLSYVNGKQWTSVGFGSYGQIWTDSWDEDWDVRSSELRVVDNRTGPLVRRIAASTNATSIEASVIPPPHLSTFEAADEAKVAQMILNGLAPDIGMTRAARAASSLRWAAGSALIVVTLAKKRRRVPEDVARNIDGSPIEIDDRWVRWKHMPLSALLWDPTNLSPNLDDHPTLIVERVLTIKEFKQEFGDPKDYGIDESNLPELGDIAPSHLHASTLAASAYYSLFSRRREEKGMRIVTLHEADPRDPTSWPLELQIIDTAANTGQDEVQGHVLNWDDPTSPFGHHQRPVFKLDGFKRDDGMLAHGVPHILMSDQDRLNILRSLQFQQLVNMIYGQWLVETRTANREQFAADLSTGVGGILRYDSHGGELPPPQVINPPGPDQSSTVFSGEILQNMQSQAHITQANLGIGKTHIPQASQQALLQEGNTVIDNIILADVDTYSEALDLTLGTIRMAAEGPNRMLARLRDKHGFRAEDLQVFLNVKPLNSPLIVRVRQHSIVSRSVDERTQQLLMGVNIGAITPKQAAIAMADELERPMVMAHELQLQFCENAVRQIVAGAEWPGMPNLDLEIFTHVIEKAMWGLDILKQGQREAITRIQQALLIQKQLSMENQLPTQGLAGQQAGGQKGRQQPKPPGPNAGAASLRSLDQGAPESINPLSNPLGAAGGLPLGLSG